MASTNIKFFKTTPYSPETKEQIWTTIVTDAHDQICGCTEPVFHLLSLLIPEDHKDRHKTVDQLIKTHFERQKCLFGGQEETSYGEAAGAPATEKEDHIKPEEEGEDPFTKIDVEDLLAAAEREEER